MNVQVLDGRSLRWGTVVGVRIGDELLEERRQRRRAGDPRLSAEGREILLRVTRGDLQPAVLTTTSGRNRKSVLLGATSDRPTSEFRVGHRLNSGLA